MYVENQQQFSRVGVSSVKNYGNSVQRNKITRRIRSIIHMISIKPGKDIVIMARKKSKITKFSLIKEELLNLINVSGLSKWI